MSEPSAAQSRMRRILRRLVKEWEPWCLPLVGAALFLAVVEFILAWNVFPAAFSSVGGALENVALLAGVYLPVALSWSLAAAAFWHVLNRRRVPASDAFAFSLALWVAGGVAWLPTHFLSRTRLDFQETTQAFWLISHGASATAAWVCFALTRGLFRRGARYFKQRLLWGLWFLGNAVTCLVVAHTVFSPVHLTTLAAVLGGAASLLALLGMRYLIQWRNRWSTSLAAAGSLLFLLSLFQASREARFFQYTAASTAAPISALVRQLFDRDQDGAAGPAWGGADCAPSDPARGPGQIEVAGDGVDQDCSGQDAKVTARSVEERARGASSLQECARAEPLSLILIVIDAMRADALNERLMPRLSAFARQALRYERAYSPSTMTRPSMGSIMTGLSVSELYRPNILRPGAPVFGRNLPELLTAQGVKTMSVGWYPLDEASRSGFASRNPLAIDVQPHKGQLLSAGVTQTTLSYLEQLDQKRSFIWAHYSDAHAPHALTESASGYPVSAGSSYERSLEYIDHHLGRLLRSLDRGQRLEHTAVIITADHGEDLGDRGRLGHGPYLFEDATRVPLVVKVPGCSPGVIHSPVSVSWLGATMASLTGVSLPGHFLPANDAEPTEPVVVEESPLFKTGMKRALIFEHQKLVVDVQNGGRALFDLKRDPGEERNVYHRATQARHRLESLYQRWLDEQAVPATSKSRP